MKVAAGPMVTKFIEVIFAVIIVSVYYGTKTLFKVKGYDEDDPDCQYPGDKFGQFVIIGGLILGIVMMGVTMFLDNSKIFALAIIVYNVLWFVFYISAAIMILCFWSGGDKEWDNYCTRNATEADDKGLKKMRNGGLTVGSFLIFENVVLLINTGLVFMEMSD